MKLRRALKGQYHASLAMVRQAVERCPEGLWLSGHPSRPYWRIAYHAIFYAHLYLMPSESDFRAWEHHQERVNSLATEEASYDHVTPYTKSQLLEYWAQVDGMVDAAVDLLDLDAATCGFHWYNMPKLDHQILNIRHIQQHAGQLSELLMADGIETDWTGSLRDL